MNIWQMQDRQTQAFTFSSYGNKNQVQAEREGTAAESGERKSKGEHYILD